MWPPRCTSTAPKRPTPGCGAAFPGSARHLHRVPVLRQQDSAAGSRSHRVLARRLRFLAQAVGRETGHDPDGSIARWVCRDRNWSPHRYAVYLSFMHAAAHQTASTDGWPSDASPDLLEYALFSTGWT
ncbi:hypothetical protein [Streptomyces bungoensis]|uniref:8-oxoguanine DNA glycosylase OGG fold protein n=1 Tax=Streptomyces bungoensis TaxID=285568 RepID=UPI000A91BBBB